MFNMLSYLKFYEKCKKVENIFKNGGLMKGAKFRFLFTLNMVKDKFEI